MQDNVLDFLDLYQPNLCLKVPKSEMVYKANHKYFERDFCGERNSRNFKSKISWLAFFSDFIGNWIFENGLLN